MHSIIWIKHYTVFKILNTFSKWTRTYAYLLESSHLCEFFPICNGLHHLHSAHVPVRVYQCSSAHKRKHAWHSSRLKTGPRAPEIHVHTCTCNMKLPWHTPHTRHAKAQILRSFNWSSDCKTHVFVHLCPLCFAKCCVKVSLRRTDMSWL